MPFRSECPKPETGRSGRTAAERKMMSAALRLAGAHGGADKTAQAVPSKIVVTFIAFLPCVSPGGRPPVFISPYPIWPKGDFRSHGCRHGRELS